MTALLVGSICATECGFVPQPVNLQVIPCLFQFVVVNYIPP